MTERTARARERLAGETLVAPELVDPEVVDLPLRRLLPQRIWQLRHVVTSYDATYVALTEVLDAVRARSSSSPAAAAN